MGIAGIAVLVASGAAVPAAADPPTPTPAPPSAATGAPPPQAAGGLPGRKITLITGDVVLVRRVADRKGRPRYTATPLTAAPRPAGSPPVRFQTLETPAGDLYVIPSDAQGLFAEQLVERDLFNVRALAEQGHTDDREAALPVIVQYGAAAPGALARQADALPAAERPRALESITGAAVRLAKPRLAEFWAKVAAEPAAAAKRAAPAPGRAGRPALGAGLRRIWLDRTVRPALDQSVPQIGAPTAWAAGHDGTGATVAVLDTGIDAAHPDVKGKIDATENFSADASAADGHGHGTHVAATIAGTGAASGGRHRGVAPGARLMVGKVLADSGEGPTSAIIDGMEWAAGKGARVVNMSLGIPAPSDGTDPFSQAVDRLTATTGTLFVVAAGNTGGAGTIGPPGAAPSALTVGAVDKRDALAPFSSQGPLQGSGALKPDITAPGVDIVAARAAGTSMPTPVNDLYTSARGTSMAAPHVAGAAAILAARHPGWKAAALKSALTGTARPNPDLTVFQQGAGRVDVARAVEQTVTADVSSLGFGLVAAPYRTEPRPVTLTNHGAAPLTLTLTAEVRRGKGAPIAGAGIVSPGTVTIPPGGTAGLTVALDLTGDAGFGAYGGAVRATGPGGAEVLRLAVGAVKETPGQNLTLRAIPPKGWPTQQRIEEFVYWNLLRLDEPGLYSAPRDVPVSQIRVPRGTYMAITHFLVYDPETGDLTTVNLVDPEVKVERDTEVVIDGRRAKPVTVKTPRPAEQRASHQALIRETAQVGAWAVGWRTAAGGSDVLPSAAARDTLAFTPTEPVTTGTLRSTGMFTLAEPRATARVLGRDAPKITLSAPHYHFAQPRLDTTRTVQVADVGAGGAEEIARAGVRGKLALVSWSWRQGNAVNTGHARQLLDRLGAAGALGVIAYSDEALPYWEWQARDQPAYADRVAVPVLSAGPGEGAALRALTRKRPVFVELRARAEESYLYHLRLTAGGDRIADPPAYEAGADRLAEVDARYRADAPAAINPALLSYGTDGVNLDLVTLHGGPALLTAPRARTEYYGATSRDVVWYRFAQARALKERWADFGDLEEQGWDVFARPERTREDWFAPQVVGAYRARPEADALASRLILNGAPATVCTVCRDARDLIVFPWLTGAIAHKWGAGQDYATTRGRLSRDGREIPSAGGFPRFDLSGEPGAARYRLEHRATTLGRLVQRATDVTTTWEFTSQAPAKDEGTPQVACVANIGTAKGPCRIERVPLIRYGLASVLALDNTARAPGLLRLPLEVYHQDGPEQTAITGLTLKISYDRGRTWKDAPARRTGEGRYEARIIHPPLAEGTTVSLRATARNAAGSTVEQTVLNAYALRH
ncbi:S8 family serine peptidase [Bailinhaonella thermotolerans]|uniref:Peptidase S8/S53 domain-containing protein n=1 Tax=Bailinhaonella thermotolerans TaxID=1070861 RepID=A0A3A4BAH0_9ACTN|nr:S8 family serine peptidase [Bailinhaonella thermotolerans]RJL35583.1 hypothetical protein D5H75_01960 [Bailinhaonella thermotolerans]